MKLKIRKGATVQVIAGADKGKKGKVIEVNQAVLLVKVEGVKIETHFDKKEGLKKLEGFIDYSNVRLLEAAAAKTGKKASKTKPASKNA